MNALENTTLERAGGGAGHSHSQGHCEHHHASEAGATDTSRAGTSEGAVYTCPMHPEVRQIGPGNCPICGMALEPEVVTLDSSPNPELVDMTRRFWVGLALTLPILALEMAGHLVGGGWIDQTTSNWVQLAFATPVVLWAGWPFFERGWQSLVTRNLNMFTLIAMGVGVAASSRRCCLISFLPPSATRAAPSRSTSKRRPQLSSSSFLGRCWSCAPGKRRRGQ